jgi:hypothetical protein
VKELGFSLHNVVGVGDAENDHAFMSVCECSVAVAKALPPIKERADVVTRNDHGRGVIELAKQLLADDLHQLDANLTRDHILIGTSDGKELRMPPYGTNVLLAGTSGSGKTTLATGLGRHNYQVCIFDPEGRSRPSVGMSFRLAIPWPGCSPAEPTSGSPTASQCQSEVFGSREVFGQPYTVS